MQSSSDFSFWHNLQWWNYIPFQTSPSGYSLFHSLHVLSNKPLQINSRIVYRFIDYWESKCKWLILGNRNLRYSSILVWNDICSGRVWNLLTENNPEVPVFSCQCLKAALLVFHPTMALIIFFKHEPLCPFLANRLFRVGDCIREVNWLIITVLHLGYFLLDYFFDLVWYPAL